MTEQLCNKVEKQYKCEVKAPQIIKDYMFFYDPKSRRHFCETDDEKLHIISWAEKGILNHVRVVPTGKLR